MFVCSTCHAANPIKLGKCPSCHSFGTFIKDPTQVKHKKSTSVRQDNQWVSLHTIDSKDKKVSRRLSLQHPELERIFSKGIKQWGLYLLWWEPGIWKSTMMLQIIDQLSNHNNINIWYFSGEEDESQINDRKKRLWWESTNNDTKENISTFDIYHANRLEDILTTTESIGYDCIIIDSIQTVYTPNHESVAWSISQIKRCSEKISERCKKNGVTCFLIWHVTKWGEIAWPKYLEHIVDVVLYLEGDRYGQYRFLRTMKNRFWPTDEVGVFEMWLFGLQAVYDLKERIINQSNVTTPWNVLTIGIDNGRSILINLEVLLNKCNGKYPQRVSQWIDNKRLQIVIAIIERYLKINLSYYDIYVNIPWEFYFKDTWLDLALAVAIYSQAKNIIIDKELIFIWELWLWGQVIQTKLHSKRCKEVQDFQIIDHERMKYIGELSSVL